MTTRPSQNPNHLKPQEIGTPQSPDPSGLSLRLSQLGKFTFGFGKKISLAGKSWPKPAWKNLPAPKIFLPKLPVLTPPHQDPNHLTPSCLSLRRSYLSGAALWLSSLFYLLPALSPAAPPPELTVLRQQYDKAYAEHVTAVFDANKAALDAKFTSALDNAISTAKGAGELKTVLALEAEKNRLTDKLPMPADDNGGPEALQKLRSIYQEQLTKLEEARTTNHSALLPAYTAKLQQLEVTLTKADRVAEAAEVLTYREGLNVGSISTAATAPAAIPSTAPSPSASPSSPAPRLAKAQKAENTKRLIQWALANGHAITIKLVGKEQRIEPGAGLPDGESILVSIVRAASVPNVNEPPPWDALAGQEELRELYLASWKQSIAPQDLPPPCMASCPQIFGTELCHRWLAGRRTAGTPGTCRIEAQAF